MATEVSRSLTEINAALKSINSQLKAATTETKSLSKSLQLDPTNLNLASAKAEALKNQIALANDKVKLLREQQRSMLADGSITKTSEAYKQLERQIIQAESQAKVLRRELAETANTRLTNLQNGLSQISKVCAAILASVVAIGAAFASTGDEIAKASDKYNINAETYQKWKNIFDKVAGDSNGYTSALQSMNSLLSQVEKGSSKAQTALGLLGLTLEDLQGQGAHEGLMLILEALEEIEDVDERATIAYTLLGNAGSELAMISERSAEEIAALNAELEKAGIITDSQAQKAAELNDAFTDLKNTFKKLLVDVGESLVPTFKAFISIIYAFTPILTALAKLLNAIGPVGQMILITLLGIVAVLPGVAGLIKAVNVITATFNITLGALIAKLLIVAGLIIALSAILGSVFGRQYKLDIDTSNVEGLLDSTNVAAAANLEVATNSGNQITYNDYSTNTVNANTELDVEEVIDQLNTKVIQVGGR